MEQELYMFYQLDSEGTLVLDEDANLIIKSRPETKGLDDIRLVVHHNPQNQDTINKFIELYGLGLQWDWFIKHQEWLKSKKEFEEYVSTLPSEDEEGNPVVLPEFNGPEPTRPLPKSVDEYMEEIYLNDLPLKEYIFKLVRASQVHKITVEVDGLVFDGDEDSQRRMLSAITAANTLGLESTPWRLTDNTVADVTKDQLVRAHARAILAQGALWIPK